MEGYVQGVLVWGSPYGGVASKFDYGQICCVIWDSVS